MEVEYKELKTLEDFKKCISFQRNVFNLSEIDMFSPLLLNLIARNNPPVGISLGLFRNVNEEQLLIGLILGLASFINKSIYILILGVHPDYNNKGYGRGLFLKLREIALTREIEYAYGIIDPLEANLGRLFFTRLGFNGIKYEVEPYSLSNKDDKKYVPIDKLLFHWNLNSPRTLKLINEFDENKFDEIITPVPVATKDQLPEAKKVLVEIPSNFIQLSKDNLDQAIQWRMSTRKIFSEYINNRKYVVTDCFTVKESDSRKSYYLLEKE